MIQSTQRPRTIAQVKALAVFHGIACTWSSEWKEWKIEGNHIQDMDEAIDHIEFLARTNKPTDLQPMIDHMTPDVRIQLLDKLTKWADSDEGVEARQNHQDQTGTWIATALDVCGFLDSDTLTDVNKQLFG